jgi:hypothetical protein
MSERSSLDRRRAIGEAAFAAWSSGDPDAPERYFHPDAVLHDVVSGTFEGWPAIRAFFARGLAKWDDLTLVPDAWWSSPDGLAVHYVMGATVRDPAIYGPELVGRRWQVEAMSRMRFEGDLVVYEADFHDKGSRARSLGLPN